MNSVKRALCRWSLVVEFRVKQVRGHRVAGSRQGRGLITCERVNSAKGPDSSVGGVPVGNCLDVDHMEEEVRVRIQVQVGREEQGIGETHGKEQGEEQREQIKRTTWMTMEMTQRARADT